VSEILVEKTLSGYNLNFNGDHIMAAVSHLNSHSDGRLTGSIELTLGKSKQQEPAFTFNFTSDVTRKRLINNLNEKYPEWKWLPIIDSLCGKIQELSKAGEDDTVIQPSDPRGKHPGYYIDPVIMKGVPNVIYGDKGVNKTTLCLALMGIIQIGIKDSPCGLVADETASIALLDWENNRELTDYTASRLVEGETIPYFELPYLRCSLPLSDDMERIGAFLYKHKANLVMIDSLGKAAGSDSHDSSGKNAALRFFECLDRFQIPGLTTLIIGQNSKDDTGKRSIFGSTYYTYYSRNIFRLQRSKDKPADDEMRIALIHEESNFSTRSKPIGFRINYTKETISIVQEAASISEYMEGASQTKTLLDFLKSGGKTVSAIAVEINASDNRTRSLLSKLKSRGLIQSLGSGLYGLPTKNNQLEF